MSQLLVVPQQINISKVKMKNKLKLNHNYTIIPIHYQNKDLIFQTPKMNLPFGVTLFNEQHYLKLSFLNSDNDPQLLRFRRLIEQLGSHFQQYIFSELNLESYYFVNPLGKHQNFPHLLSTKIFNNSRENLLIFDQYKNNLELEQIQKSDYCKSIIYVSNIWINHDTFKWGYDIYALQLKIYTIYRHLSEYSFIDDLEDQRFLHSKSNTSSHESVSDNLAANQNKGDLIEIKRHPKYQKYFKMLLVGVPKDNIRSQMNIDGLDSNFIDYQPEYLIPQSYEKETLSSSNVNIQQLLQNKSKLKKIEISKIVNTKKKKQKSLFSLEDLLKRIKNLKKTNITLI